MLVAASSTAVALAAKAATKSIPIVFATGVDPVQFGLVASLSRPGGNVTGVSFAGPEVELKRLGLLHELVPQATEIAALINPDTAFAESQRGEVLAAARAVGGQVLILNVRTRRELDNAFATIVDHKIGAVLITPNPLFGNYCEQLATLAKTNAIPSISEWRFCTEAGVLLSYGANDLENYRQVGIYTGRILGGSKPADLPVLLPTKFDLVINLKTAKVIGIEVPPTFLARADEVIE